MATIITQLLLASHSTPNSQVVLLCTLAHLSTPKNFLIPSCYNSSAVYPFLSHPAIWQPNSPRMGHTSVWSTQSYTIHVPKAGPRPLLIPPSPIPSYPHPTYHPSPSRPKYSPVHPWRRPYSVVGTLPPAAVAPRRRCVSDSHSVRPAATNIKRLQRISTVGNVLIYMCKTHQKIWILTLLAAKVEAIY